LKDQSEQKDFTHLSDFLKNQIYRGQDKVNGPQSVNSKQNNDQDTFSQISKKNRYSNALIEKASREVQERRE
jgi:hypothetical protein